MPVAVSPGERAADRWTAARAEPEEPTGQPGVPVWGRRQTTTGQSHWPVADANPAGTNQTLQAPYTVSTPQFSRRVQAGRRILVGRPCTD